ncbi:unnamed protein product, partial [Penicillium egyptiacum]
HHPAEPQGGDAQPGPLLTPDEFREHLPPGMRRAFDRFPDFLKKNEVFSRAPLNDEERVIQLEHVFNISLGLRDVLAQTEQAPGQYRSEVAGKLRDLAQPEKYQGSQQGNAANNWLHDCQEYFEKRRLLSGHPEGDAYKIVLASGLLVGDAG